MKYHLEPFDTLIKNREAQTIDVASITEEIKNSFLRKKNKEKRVTAFIAVGFNRRKSLK